MQAHWLEQAEADLPAHDDWLSPDEAVLLSRLRFAKRRADWRLGRWVAKQAGAACLNLPRDPRALQDIEVRPARSGAPELFVASRPAAATISISHRAGIAACSIAMGGGSLGCDLELIEPRSGSFLADYFTSEEQELIWREPEEHRARLAAVLWSAKESTLKALREGLRLDTRCLAVAFDTEATHEEAAAATRPCSGLNRWQPLRVCYAGSKIFHGWWSSTGELVRTLVSDPAPLPPLFLRACAASEGAPA
ncbi:MAG TPA: 4'-phosphopantetheinyl transferase superfamily protein [Terriglobales bacterium]|jgi:4'-phosphopantetheinyl transferase|nr:4'-phosphopantetheinyl transferase superfamily protein [Terriglobales bacterium]